MMNPPIVSIRLEGMRAAILQSFSDSSLDLQQEVDRTVAAFDWQVAVEAEVRLMAPRIIQEALKSALYAAVHEPDIELKLRALAVTAVREALKEH